MWSIKVGLIIGLSLALPNAARADVFSFSFLGGGISGFAIVSYGPNTTAGDPAGAFKVTGISGSFSDANLGFANVAITGLAPLIPGKPSPTNLLAPASFSYLPVASGVASPEGVAPGFTADNLIYPAGSPPTATDYPFGGGFLDIYGLGFTLANGDSVNFWSDGVPPGDRLNYGAAVTNGLVPLDYVFTGIAVPEPASISILAAGIVGGLAARRRRRRATSP